MKLQFISEETLADLRNNFEDYIQYYYTQNNEWFNRYFSAPGRILESKIDFVPPKMNMDEDYAISDRENIKIVYESLSHLTESQATQERLWAGLAHLQLRDFSFYRIKEDIYSKNDKRINTSLFYPYGIKRSLFVHILARLWWVGYMTYDEKNNENPYWLTNFLTERAFSSRSLLHFSNDFTANKTISKGVLTTLYNLQQNGLDIKREHFVEANKHLNVVGGAMILDLLTVDDVEEIIRTHLEKQFDLGMTNVGLSI